MAPDGERHLLFGLIALQVGLIDQAQLVAAFQAWARDKSRSLADHLAEQGVLHADGRAAVEAMVDVHLRMHEGDLEKSLGSLRVGHATLERLAGLCDAELGASLHHVASSSSDVDADGTTTFSVGASTADGQRFRVLRPHARGGLGEVFVALDGELNREVALKQILDSHADDPTSRHRFLVEAEVTGGLEHPGIVPVYGLGVHADGRPFYAMRFIRGDSLKDAIARFHTDAGLRVDPTRRSLELRELLRRFTDVCNALGYAHARGVLHRDIKPGNIIVGKYGETLVVDWGLAKALGHSDPTTDEGTLMPSSASGSADTLPGSAIGTPAYMSPEQARGDLGAVGPRSDVYSLGATLYCLLTGKPPFDGDDVGVLLQRVHKGEFPPARQLDAAIDPALEAVCLKAMALSSADRYVSARALADDVNRWLADEPVTAYPEPFARRARRWAKRNRTLVVSGAATLVIAVMALGVVSAVQTKARNDLAAQNTALDRQRRRAEANESQAIDAVKRFRDAVADEPILKDNPELDALRKRLLKEPLAYFRALRERLQADRDTGPQSLSRLAQAMHDYAHLTDEIGDVQDGLRSHEESLTIWARLTAEHPEESDYQSGLAIIQKCRGDMLRATGALAEARTAYEAALAIQQKLADAQPTVTQYQSNLALSHNNLGILLKETGALAEARKSLDAALTIHQKLAYAHPTVTEIQRNLAISHNNLGLMLSETGAPAEARKAYEAALALQQKLADAHPDVAKYQSDLASGRSNLGNFLMGTGALAEARKAYEAALAIQQKLADKHPTVTEYQSHLEGSTYNLGNLLKNTGALAEARQAFEAALTIGEKLTRDHPESPAYASHLGATLNNMATLDINAGQFAEARVLLHQAIDWQKKALTANPRNPTYRQFLANHLTNLIKAALGLGRDDEATAAQRELAQLKASDPQFAAIQARLAAVIRVEAPKDNAERLALAQRAYDSARYATAARLWAEALAADPTLAESRQTQHCYNAACAAALAASDKANDDPAPDDTAKAKLRQQAHNWLKSELAAWSRLLQSGPPQSRNDITQTLQHWQKDTDLAGVREAESLQKLPAEERKAWDSLWAEVKDLLKKAQGARP